MLIKIVQNQSRTDEGKHEVRKVKRNQCTQQMHKALPTGFFLSKRSHLQTYLHEHAYHVSMADFQKTNPHPSQE